jgi:phosphomannomutase
MSSSRLSIDPLSDSWDEISLTDDLVRSYSLENWAANFSLMTAGYRDQLDPDDAANPEVAFNLVTLAILGEAKARVFERKLGKDKIGSVHVGGETRPHTQAFISLLSRIYSAHSMVVHLRARVNTTPIWYSSFGVFYEQIQSGDNLTASHSAFFKGGWKPMDSEGKQLLEEEEDVVREVRDIVESRATIRLAPLSSANIRRDFDADEAYAGYLKSILGDSLLDEIKRAAQSGFRCSICPVGGSMKATTERLFQLLGLQTGEGGVIQYFLDEEDSRYHGIGQIEGENFGVDPGKWQIYKNIGAQEILTSRKAHVVFIWDPDGDRFNMVTAAPSDSANRAVELGLEVETVPNSRTCVVYFTPNQIFFMLAAFRIMALRKTGQLRDYDWFVTRSVATTRSVAELAAKAGLPSADVRVGFKYMGTFAEWAESRKDPAEPFISPTGERVVLGANPRPLIMCEESGGGIFSGADLLWNRSTTRGMLALREKDAMQIGALALSLAAHLYNSGRSFADFYCDTIVASSIRYKYFDRRDVRLYDESLVGAERQIARREGIAKRDRVIEFFADLAREFASGSGIDGIYDKLCSRLSPNEERLPHPRRVCNVGDGTLLEFAAFWCVIRASGTDAVLRYYIEGETKQDVELSFRSLVSIQV